MEITLGKYKSQIRCNFGGHSVQQLHYYSERSHHDVITN